MQKTIVVTWDQSEAFKKSEPCAEITNFWNEIVLNMTEEQRIHVSEQKPFLDFQLYLKDTEEHPLHYIPYKFKIKYDPLGINKFLEEFTIYSRF